MTERPQTAARAPWALAGLLLSLGGWACYVIFLGNAWVRSTGLPAFVLLVLGAAVASRAVRGGQRGWARHAAAATVLSFGVFVVYFFVFSRLPSTNRAVGPAVAPAFSAVDHLGNQVSLNELRAAGPVLLVFYRGHW